MARYLVVAHETVTSPLLLNAVRGVRERDAEAEFVMLVPATPVRYLLFRKGDEHDAEATARKRGERARALFTKRGVPLSDVHVGAADPAEAIDQEVAAHPGYAGFIISTLPAEKSRWLLDGPAPHGPREAQAAGPPRRRGQGVRAFGRAVIV